MLFVRLLGEPQLALDQTPIRVTRRKGRALVYYLAAHNRPISREHLLSALEAGGWLVGDEITIDVEIELIKQAEPVEQLEAVAA